VTEAPFVNGDSTAPGEIADLRRVGISPDFWYPVTVSVSVWKEASHPGNHPERTTAHPAEVEARGKSPAQKGKGHHQTPHSRGRHRRVGRLMYG
jgi:hypothetical protein